MASAFGEAMFPFTIGANPGAMAGTDDTDLSYLLQAVGAKGKTAITAPGKPFNLLANQARMKRFYGRFPSSSWGDICVHAALDRVGCGLLWWITSMVQTPWAGRKIVPIARRGGNLLREYKKSIDSMRAKMLLYCQVEIACLCGVATLMTDGVWDIGVYVAQRYGTIICTAESDAMRALS